jgi:hypothetical protein
MACSLTQHGNSPYTFTATPGTINLVVQQPTSPAGATVIFDPTDKTFAITDQNNQSVAFKLAADNQSLTFKAVKGTSYSLVLPFLCLPSSCVGLLQEGCPGSALNLSLISVNDSVEISIAC